MYIKNKLYPFFIIFIKSIAIKTKEASVNPASFIYLCQAFISVESLSSFFHNFISKQFLVYLILFEDLLVTFSAFVEMFLACPILF